jgi:SAM-dependent methyltransferase
MNRQAPLATTNKRTTPSYPGAIPGCPPFGPEYWASAFSTFLTPQRAAIEAEVISKLLCLTPGARVLDMGCGAGRIASALGVIGFRVVGVDGSFSSLASARDASPPGCVSFLQGDLRTPVFSEAVFDAAVSWYTSLGYGSEADDSKILSQACYGLRPHAKLLIDHINRNRAMHRLPRSELIETPRGHIQEHCEMSSDGSRVRIARTVTTDGVTTGHEYEIRVYSPEALAALVEEAGMQAPVVLGPYGEPFEAASSRRMVLLADKGC